MTGPVWEGGLVVGEQKIYPAEAGARSGETQGTRGAE